MNNSFDYNQLDQSIIDFIIENSNIRKCRKGEVVFLESDESKHVYFVKTGQIKICRLNSDGKEVLITVLGKGNFFGEMGVLDDSERSTGAESESQSELLVIDKAKFLELLEKHPELSIELLVELTGRIRKSDSQLKGLSILNANSKVAASLLRWAKEYGENEGEKLILSNVVNQSDMASYVGLTRETFNRNLHILCKEGYIDICKDGRIVINNYIDFLRIFSIFY